MGRVFMDALDDPFAAVERELAACPLKTGADAIVLDMHGEATSEKQAMGFFVDGRASLVVGTHTHCPTADHRILPGRTAFVSDVGMTGDFEFGDRHGQGRAAQPLPAQGAGRQIRAGERARHAVRASRSRPTMRPGSPRKVGAVRLGGILEEARPEFWD